MLHKKQTTMDQRIYQKAFSGPSEVVNGLLFIPDISGFSEFVYSTDVLTGRYVTYELLSAIINQNELQLNVAEVEGDAVLFYRQGDAPTLQELIKQYDAMMRAFENKRKELEANLKIHLDISLKIIAHYGSMVEYTIGQFKKLYGEVVIEAHRLLKNSIDSDTYLLLTDTLLEQICTMEGNEKKQGSLQSKKLCEIYGAVTNICFTYFDFKNENVLQQVA